MVMIAALVAGLLQRAAAAGAAPAQLGGTQVRRDSYLLHARDRAAVEGGAQQHAPDLKAVSYTGCPTAGDAVAVAGGRAARHADIVLVTYEVLMKELVHVDRSFESDERRAGLAARAPEGFDARPSPLKYLTSGESY